MSAFRLPTIQEDLDAIYDPNHYSWCAVNNIIYHVYNQTIPQFDQLLKTAEDFPPWFVPLPKTDRRIPIDGVTVVRVRTRSDAEGKNPFRVVYEYGFEKPISWVFPGGPSPLSLALVGGAYGLILGKLGQLFVNMVDPAMSEHIETSHFPILGAILGSLPPFGIGFLRALAAEDKSAIERLKEFVRPFKKSDTTKPETSSRKTEKKAQYAEDFSSALDVGLVAPPASTISETHWRDVVLGDPFLTRKEKAIATAPFYAAGLATGSRFVTPVDVASVTANTLLGGAFGLGLSNIAGKILGLSPDARRLIVQSGVLTGLLRGLINRFAA